MGERCGGPGGSSPIGAKRVIQECLSGVPWPRSLVHLPWGVNRLGPFPGPGGSASLDPTNIAASVPDSSPSAQAAFDGLLTRVAAGDGRTTVLLTGESGAGKSRAAALIHRRSGRANGPLVTAHLAGLSPALIEAELFGHREGSFTGARADRRGRFELADGGTIVLEAVETLAMDLQVKLLRVLQERVIEPVGAEAPVPVDVRVIATTALDLRQAVEQGHFREDLYFRLAVLPLEVPPLRTRVADPAFPALCDGLLGDIAGRLGREVRPLSDAARERLGAHPWPGNFRELENALERVLVLGPAGAEPIGPGEFDFLGEALHGRAEELAREALAAGVGVADLERALFEAALEECRGNVSAAARALSLSRRAFDYRRKKMEADR